MPAVAVLLLGGQALGHHDREARLLPLAEAARHGGDVRVSELLQALGSEGAARAARTVDDDLPGFVRDLLFDPQLQESARDVYSAGNVPVRPLVGLAHIDEDGALVRLGARLLRRHFPDLRLDLADQLLERGHTAP